MWPKRGLGGLGAARGTSAAAGKGHYFPAQAAFSLPPGIY